MRLDMLWGQLLLACSRCWSFCRRNFPLSWAALCLIAFWLTGEYQEKLFYYHNYILLGGEVASKSWSSDAASETSCKLPLHLKPDDPSISQFRTSLPDRIICDAKASGNSANDTMQDRDLTWVDTESNRLSAKSSDGRGDLVTCCARYFGLRAGSDVDLDYSHPWQVIRPEKGILMTFPFVQTKCFHDKKPIYMQNQRNASGFCETESGFYSNTHFAFIPPSSHKMPLNSSAEKPNVLFLVIESLSRLNYLRNMPQTRSVLENETIWSEDTSAAGKVHYLKGLTKLADNSYPNMVPLLTGKRIYKKELANDIHGPYDDWPFIWKRFADLGYWTGLIEDLPTITLFNYLSQGFLRGPPVDWYPRPFWLQVENFLQTLRYCMKTGRRSIAKVEVFLDQVRIFLRAASRRRMPFFLFSFYIQVTHNDFNQVQLLDHHYAEFLSEMAPSLREDTIVILMGDHGNRFGPFLTTIMGRVEERMPLVAIRIPNKLREAHPHLSETLTANENSLTTWLDLHSMLQDIVKGTYEQVHSIGDSLNEKRAYSLWREKVSPKRTCVEALIPEAYCVCENRLLLPVNHPVIQSAAESLINALNDKLPDELCAELSISRIISGEVLFPSTTVAQAKGFIQRVELSIELAPSGGIVRSLLSRTAFSTSWSVPELAHIARLNKYGNQSACVTDRELRKFCLCH